MRRQALETRVVRLEQRMDLLGQLPERMDRLDSQFLQFRGEVRDEFAAVRLEMHAMGAQLRTEMKELGTELRSEIRDGDEETRRQMRVLHEEVIARLTLIQESRPTPARSGSSGRARRRTKE